MINIFENVKTAGVILSSAWLIIKYTLLFVKTITGVKIAYQMFCLSMHLNPIYMINYLETQTTNGFDFFKGIINMEKHWV